ncbi:hypothetical protein HNR35_001027, partial [Borreliella spielmanii]|nr:hypothetical protein [Borreliella spielmanii]
YINYFISYINYFISYINYFISYINYFISYINYLNVNQLVEIKLILINLISTSEALL